MCNHSLAEFPRLLGWKERIETMKTTEKTYSYWGNKGKHQALADKLNKLVPPSGPIKGAKNRMLEKFRKASNAYYDIFNNGGCNRGRSIRAIFGISMRNYKSGRSCISAFGLKGIYAATEPVMDKIILAAAVEQGLIS